MRVCQSCVTRARISASLSRARRARCAGSSRAVEQLRRSRARRRGCSCAAPRSGARSAPARCRRAPASAAIVVGARCRPCASRSKRHRERALLQVPLRARASVAPAHVVAVLGDVGQVREVAEGADHAHRLVALERLFSSRSSARPAAGVALQPVGDRELADALDQRRRPPRPPARGSRRRGCGRAGGCRRPAAGSSLLRRLGAEAVRRLVFIRNFSSSDRGRRTRCCDATC